MAVSSLLEPDSLAFGFDHDQMHRRMAYALPNGPGFSGIPYLLDPIIGANVPFGYWNKNHAQAHSDFASANPAIFWPSTAPIVDIDLNSGATKFWAFSNRQLHNLANSALPPARV